MKDEIKLKSRYGVRNSLLKIKDKTYKLITPHSYRIGYIAENKKFIDPSGGPMMIEGEYLEEAKAVIDTIKDGTITFK